MLHEPDRHFAPTLAPLDDADSSEAISALVEPLAAAMLPNGTWPVHPRDDDNRTLPESGLTSLYMGAGGCQWALADLAARGHCSWEAKAADLLHIWARDYPQEGEPDAPSWFIGRSGMAAMALSHSWDSSLAAALHKDIVGNRENPTWEALWGSPGTMLAARMVHDFAPTPERWKAAFLDSASALLGARDEDGIWTQDLYGRVRQLIGAGHGYVGNLQALLAGRDWLEDEILRDLMDQAATNLSSLARFEDGACNWSPEVAREEPDKRLNQWCHGAAGVLISFRRAPEHEKLDDLLRAAGHAVWRAGPLTKGPGLCHGTAGNGYALLVLHERTGDEVWLDRARVFAAHAVHQVRERRQEHGLVRASLFTGDVGVACLLGSIIDRDPTWPLLDVG